MWPLLALLALLVVAATGWFVISGDQSLFLVAGPIARTVLLGLVGSFALHEVAHVALLRRIPTVTHLVVERTAWRLSVIPLGSVTPREAGAVAIAGPGACLLVAPLWGMVLPGSGLAWWYAAHLVFLLPVFGDGRVLLASLRAGALEAGGRP